jgi:hypothetical protein
MSKLKFEQMHVEDQFALTMKMMEMIAEGNCKSIHELADARGKDPRELWSEFCAEAGFDECEPWTGYPSNVPTLEALSQSPGVERKLEGEYLKFWERYKALTGRDKS